MSDCQVLDADTQLLNQHKRQIGESAAAITSKPAPVKQHQPNYVSVEAENGAVIKVDMNSIQRGDGAAIVFTYSDEGRPEDAYNLQGYMFDCQGHYSLNGTAIVIFRVCAATIGSCANFCFGLFSVRRNDAKIEYVATIATGRSDNV